jgi:hypothetical protein
MTPDPDRLAHGGAISRRSLLKIIAAVGGVSALGISAGCATPTGLPGPGTVP